MGKNPGDSDHPYRLVWSEEGVVWVSGTLDEEPWGPVTFPNEVEYQDPSTGQVYEGYVTKLDGNTATLVYEDEEKEWSFLEDIDARLLTVKNASEELLRHVRNSRTSDLPVFLSPALFRRIMEQFIDVKVVPLCQELLEDVVGKMRVLTEQCLVTQVDAPFKLRFPLLPALLRRLMVAATEATLDTAQEFVDTILKSETTPYSQNDYLYETLRKKRNEKLQKAVVAALKSINNINNLSAVLAAVKGLFEANQKLSPDEYNAQELHLILQAYWKVAAKRIIDGIPGAINSTLLDRFGPQLKTTSKIVDSAAAQTGSEDAVTTKEDVLYAFDEGESVVYRRQKTGRGGRRAN